MLNTGAAFSAANKLKDVWLWIQSVLLQWHHTSLPHYTASSKMSSLYLIVSATDPSLIHCPHHFLYLTKCITLFINVSHFFHKQGGDVLYWMYEPQVPVVFTYTDQPQI